MQAIGETRHWWSLVFIDPMCGGLAGVFVTEAGMIDVAVARAELSGARPPGTHISASPFQASYVHTDFVDVLMTCAEFHAMPMPRGFSHHP